MNCLHRRVPVISAAAFALFAAGVARAQFKVVGPAPVPPAAARQQIKTALEKADPGNPKPAIDSLSSLLAWYRDIIDDELIAAWKKDTRTNLIEVMEALADARVATAAVNFSWREEPAAAFNLSDAPLLGHLMVRFPESAQPFLDDLLGPQPPALSDEQAKAVCRVLVDMPDVGTWKQNARRILPRYRRAAQSLLNEDVRSSDREKSFRAEVWLSDLKMDAPGAQPDQPGRRRRLPSYQASQSSAADREPSNPAPVLMPPADADRTPPPAPRASPPVRPPPPPVVTPVTAPAPVPAPDLAPAPANPTPRAPAPLAPTSVTPAYEGAKSGTLESTGSAIPQNAEYVFRNLPGVKLQLDYDQRIWEARLVPGEGQTQKLILRNKSSGPQKRCVVHWSTVP